MDLLKNLTIKNLKLNKKRTIVTIIGIILSVALITAVASMFFSARESLIKFEVEQEGNYHYGFTDVPIENLVTFRLNRKIEKIYSAPGYTFITYLDENNITEKVDVYIRYKQANIKNHAILTANILNVDGIAFDKVYGSKEYTLSLEQYNEAKEMIENGKLRL